MSNSTIKRGSKLTVTTDKGITNLTNTNNIGIAEISGPVMTDISDSFKLTSITNANLPQLRIGTTDSSGSLQLGVFKNSNNKTLSILQSSFDSSTGDNDNVKGYNHLTLQPKGGNLGIRTNDPLAIFDINNMLLIDPVIGYQTDIGHNVYDSDGFGSYKNIFQGGSSQIQLAGGQYNQAYISFRLSNTNNDTSTPAGFSAELTEAMRIIRNGNIGIGTSNPPTELSVNGKISLGYDSASNQQFTTSSSGPFQDASIFISKAVTSGSYPFGGTGHLVLQGRTNDNIDIVFATGETPQVSMVITGDNLVGIGTTNPPTELSVNGKISLGYNSASNQQFTTSSSGPFQDASIFISKAVTSGVYPFSGSGHLVLQGRTNDGYDIVFATGETPQLSMVITGDNLVGIGTTNPVSILDINYNSTTTPALTLRNGNGQLTINDGAQISFSYDGDNTYKHFIHTRHNATNDNNAFDFYVCDGTENNSLTSGSTHVMTIENGGVGIGTTNPIGKFHVHGGGVYIYSNVSDAGYGDAETANIYFDVNTNSTPTPNGIIWKPEYSDSNGTYTKKSAGIYFQPENSYFRGGIAFYTNDTASRTGAHEERMRIDMEGNVGIGTTNPTLSNVWSGSSYSASSVSTLDVYGKIRFGTDSNNNMRSELGGTYSNAGLFLGCYNTDSGVGDYYKLKTYMTTSANYPAGFIVTGYNGGHTGLAFGVLDTNTSTSQDYTTKIAMLIKEGGKIGIGTTNPTSALSVVGGRYDSSHPVGCHLGQASNYSFLELCNSTGGQIDFASGDGSNDFNGRINYLHSNNNMSFYTAGSERMVINGSGNVGIGTTSPSYKLQISQDSGGEFNGIQIASGRTNKSSSNKAQILFSTRSSGNTQSTTNVHYTIGHGYNGTSYGFGLGYGSGSITSVYDMWLDSGGKVGIGTGSMKAKLHVEGVGGTEDIGGRAYLDANSTPAHYASSSSSGTFGIYASHAIWSAGHVFSTSDMRIKENIRDVSDTSSLQTLRDISCVYYEYRDKISKGSDTTIGFIAQQVKLHMPMAVSIQSGIIPNEMRVITDYSWNTILYDNSDNIITERIYDESGNDITKEKYKLTIHDLSDNSGNIENKFYVSNDPSGNDECEKNIYSLSGESSSFIFDESWNHIFLYGNQVDDLNILDKDKLFALNFSATQEIDKQQQADKLRIATLEAEVTSLKSQIASILQRLDNGGL